MLATSASSAAQNRSIGLAGVPQLRPAAAIGKASAVARTVATANGRRVAVSAHANGAAAQLGPRGAGDDGAPAMVALPGGDFLVVAARWSPRGAELWSQTGNADGWRRARRMGRSGTSDHHPALGAGQRAVWMTWVAEDASGSSSLLAAAWNGRTLSPPEPLPAIGDHPGVPRIAVDGNEQPAVVWSAFDGTDTEIWISRRGAAGWSTPEPLTDNDVPDEFPDIGRGHEDALVVSWSGYSPTGYQPFATYENLNGAFAAPTRLDANASGATSVLGGADDAIAWAEIRPETYELRMAARTNRGWQRAAAGGEVGSPRLHAALRGRRLLVASSADDHAEGRLRRSNEAVHPGADLPLAPASPRTHRAAELPLPGTYRAFGDSITEGVIRPGDVPISTPGYPVPLATFLGAFLNQPGVFVANDGVGGENTSEGLGRLAGLNARSPRQYAFIMEGANDAVQLVDANTVAANLRGMVRNTIAVGGVPIISTVTPRNQAGFVGGGNVRVARYNELIVPMARAEDALLVDQWSVFFRQPSYFSDLQHPTVQGYTVMAVAWFRGLQPLLASVLQSEDDAAAAARARARAGRQRPGPAQ